MTTIALRIAETRELIRITFTKPVAKSLQRARDNQFYKYANQTRAAGFPGMSIDLHDPDINRLPKLAIMTREWVEHLQGWAKDRWGEGVTVELIVEMPGTAKPAE